jgi:hypothetical protein
MKGTKVLTSVMVMIKGYSCAHNKAMKAYEAQGSSLEGRSKDNEMSKGTR